MPFTVEDFEDLLRLLYERPDWRDRLQRVILPPELFELPRIAQELAESNRAERERVARLEAEQQATRKDIQVGFAQTGEHLDRVEKRVGHVETELVAFRAETNARFEQVDQRFDRVDTRFDRVDGRLQQLSTDLGTLKGTDMEERIQKHVPRFRHVILHPVALTPVEVAALMDSEVAAGRLAPGEARQVERADLIVRSADSGESPYLVLEISWLVEERDVRRAHHRAALLRRAGYDARAAVAGTRIQPDAMSLAERLGVVRTIDDEIDAELDAELSIGDESR